MSFSSLETRILHRKGALNITERYSTDFVVDGNSLLKTLQPRKSHNTWDFMGRFLCGQLKWNHEISKIFLVEEKPDLDNGRVMIYVCPECGDIGCGAITLTIAKHEDYFIWKDFCYENDYDQKMTDFDSFALIGPFYFKEIFYRALIDSCINL